VLRVWIQGIGPGCEGLVREVAGALAPAGVEAVLDEPDTGQMGVVLFEAIDRALLQWVASANPTRRARIVAVAAREQEAGDGQVWSLLAAGASEVLAWNGGEAGARIAARLQRWHRVDELVRSAVVRERLVGSSPLWVARLRTIVEAAAFTDAPVLILGESGTGKEQVAHVIHELDARPARRELVICDCSTITAELAGSEFFGHERGAFTGAMAARDGAFALADGGTLFLDEVGELPPPLQAQLLRVVQERTYKRVGGNIWYRTAFRLVCATNRPLGDDVARNRFRSDLFQRIASWVVTLPPLRERREDIVPLALHFLDEQRGGDGLSLDQPVRLYLERRDYPGNIRELRQLVRRMAARHVGPGPITVGDIPEDERPSAEPAALWPDQGFDEAIARAVSLRVGLREIGRVASERAIEMAVGCEDGNLQRAARRLGVTDRALQMRRAQKAG
jgi:transcriptional regulator with GAF, ATPase, and Fis domain